MTTPTNNPARAATAGELLKLRSTPYSVFTARVNQASFAYPLTQITYDGGVGTFANVKAGMYLWIGSAAGLKDKGIARIRTTADATKIYVNTLADGDVTLADNYYLTVYSEPSQASTLGLVIQHPATVYTARINQTFTTLDKVTQLTYDGGSGTLANVLEGMTVYIGSTAGARDKGECRIRKTPTSSIFYIGETSAIQFADNDYITIVDSFFFHPRPLSNDGGVIRMDSDIELGDLTRGGFIPRLGPVAAVIEQTSGTITFTPPNPSLSSAYDGATLDSLEFSAPGASGTSNMTSATDASWTYPTTANQEYRWSCAITDDLGRETPSYRRVFVNPTEIPFSLNYVSGDFESAGWSFEVTVFADPGTIYDRALCVLYARDYYGRQKGAIGKLAGYENIIATGWIDGESIEQDADTGWVTFTVQGAAFWMDKVNIDPIELTSVLPNPVQDAVTTWNQIESMTADKAMAHILYWMTTVPLFMDCFLSDDENVIRYLPVAGGSLLGQLNAIAGKVFAKPLVNNYGQLFVEVDAQIAPSATQATFPIVMDIQAGDYEKPFSLDVLKTPKTTMVQLGALQSSDGVLDLFVYSRAPGNAPFFIGMPPSTYDDYIVTDANECNRIAGVLYAVENNQYDTLELTIPAVLRLFDIAPRMFATITTDGTDNPRGVAFTSQDLIPRKVAYTFDGGVSKTIVTFEVKVTGTDGIDYFPPSAEDENLDGGLEDFGNFNLDFPSLDGLFPETVPPEVTTPCNRNMGNSFTLTWSPRTLTGSTSQLIAKALFPCMVRATGGLAGDTYIRLSDIAFGDADSHKTCYATMGGTRILTGTWVGDVITFSPLSDTQIDGFEIELDAGAGSVIDRFAVGKLLETGDMSVDTTLCVNGKWYAIEAYQGYWTATFPADTVGKNFYNVFLPPGNSFRYMGAGKDGNGDFHTYLVNGSYVERGNDRTEVFNTSTQLFEVGGNYARIYFQASASQVTLSASSSDTLGRSYHGMKWALYEAQAIGRQLVLGPSTLHNVCAIE